ncbi:hypothetical protein CsatB_000328 [Cannabis sativa]|uniref:Macrophage migration inhibitory factor n=1 Tax=Cannabis sativa TaxID=3483 RepID=A0A7J6G7U0_CANSA|nr:hypothetical protein F8388_022118 [Cannabis sativa]
MPCLYITTNVNLEEEGVDTDSIFSEATKAVSAIFQKPENFVMVILKGSVSISFGGNKEPAAYAEVVTMGGLNSAVKKRLISTLGAILHSKLNVPPPRFFLKAFDTTAGRTSTTSNSSKL